MNFAVWCCSWSSGEALQQAGSGSILFPTRLWPQVPHLPAGSACSFTAKTARLGRLPELRQAVRALAAAQVSCAMASLCLLSLSREGALVPGWRAWLWEVGLAPLGGLTSARSQRLWQHMAAVAACAGVATRAGPIPTCGRKEGFVADRSCNVFLARKGSFEPLVPVTESNQRSLASCHAWLFTDPSGKGVLAPFASLCPGSHSPEKHLPAP